jgi:hypothetical protein
MAPNDVTELKMQHMEREIADLRKDMTDMKAKYDGHIVTVVWGALGVAALVVWEPIKAILTGGRQ